MKVTNSDVSINGDTFYHYLDGGILQVTYTDPNSGVVCHEHYRIIPSDGQDWITEVKAA